MKLLEWTGVRRWMLVMLVASALALASCGGDDDEAPVPEIEIRDDSGNVILSTTTVDFGPASQSGLHATKTLWIYNLGSAHLTLNAVPTIGGTDSTFYLMTTDPVLDIGDGGSTFFVVDFPNDFDMNVPKSATITVSSNDADEGSFTFGVTGVANS